MYKSKLEKNIFAFAPVYLNLDYFFNLILRFLTYIFNIVVTDEFIKIFHFLLGLIAIFFMAVICYSIIRILEIRKEEKERHHTKVSNYQGNKIGKNISINEKWENILFHLNSMNENDWRIAIIESDLILENLTKKLNLAGDNLGERLKSANRDKFKTLDNAWEAHIVRNKIAHEGSNFPFSKREAERVVALYETVFREFGEI